MNNMSHSRSLPPRITIRLVILLLITAACLCIPASAADLSLSAPLADCSQLILVEVSNDTTSYASVSAWENTVGGTWALQQQTTAGRVGSKGVTPIPQRMQSTNKTPAGYLTIQTAMGILPDPGSQYPYTRITDNMYWDLNSTSPTYNQLVYRNPGGDSEHLASYTTTYKYLFTTDYNIAQTPLKGGAIFLHCNGAGATSGCISVPDEMMEWLMKWADPRKNTKILVVTTANRAAYLAPDIPELSTAQWTANGVLLEWQPMAGVTYSLQRSEDGMHFETVRQISDPSVSAWTDPTGTPNNLYRIAVSRTIGNVVYQKVSKSLPVSTTFRDVSDPAAYYYIPVQWAVENGITNGMTPTTFEPTGICTRGQAVTFLWRAMGTPEPKTQDNPFIDVQPSFYYTPVLWASETGITKGISEDLFFPAWVVTRAQFVTFLWRAAGCPAPVTDSNPFEDVPDGVFYHDAVLWAVEEGITKGMSETMFYPEVYCNRGQVVTFLYRYYAEAATSP